MLSFAPKYLNSTLDESEKFWLNESMGGKTTIANYGHNMDTLKKHIEWLKTLPHYIEIDNFFITHGFGLPYCERRDKEEAKKGLLYNRIHSEEEWGHEWEKDWQNYQIFNVFGHTPYKEPRFTLNYCGIDTGCGYGGKLSALKLGTKEVICVDDIKIDILMF